MARRGLDIRTQRTLKAMARACGSKEPEWQPRRLPMFQNDLLDPVYIGELRGPALVQRAIGKVLCYLCHLALHL